MRYDTVTIQQQPPVVEKDNQVRSSLSDKFRSARLIGAAVTTILLFPAIAVLILTKANWVAIGWTIFGCFAIGLTVGGYLTIKWAYEHAVRPWEVDDEERSRQYIRDDWEFEQERRRAAEVLDRPANPDVNRIDQVARDILKRYYTKQPITREECEKAGVCSQVEWNQVNKAFQVIGWKRGYKFYPPDEFKLAYAIWGSKTEWFNNALWAKDPRGNLKLVE